VERVAREIVVDCCAGIDGHTRTVVVCRRTRDAQGARVAQTQTVGTTTGERLRLADWLAAGGCTPVGLERTGQFCTPVFPLLDGPFAVWLLNAHHLQAVPGRQTDVKDAQRIAAWVAHGLGRPRFIPPHPPREWRDLTRYRTPFVRERATVVTRVHPVLEGATRTVAAVATALMGVWGRAILAALLTGEADPTVLAERARGPLRKKRPHLQQALQGHRRPQQRFVLSAVLPRSTACRRAAPA
jgi:hypothetical protein